MAIFDIYAAAIMNYKCKLGNIASHTMAPSYL